MADIRDALFELGTEELPPKGLKKLSAALTAEVEAQLRARQFEFAGIDSFATPRRLAVRISGLNVQAKDQSIEKLGPAVAAAFGPDGTPTKAAEGFARGLGCAVADLARTGEGKNERLVYRATLPGPSASEALPAIVAAALDALPIAKRMRWGAGDAEFVRPVHWAVLLLGGEVIDAEILGVRTGRVTRGHRCHSQGGISLAEPADYETKLRADGSVIASFETRKAQIRAAAEETAASVGGTAVIDADLLDEVAALSEWPIPVMGGFEARFLDLPAEVLITTMQANQKYFPIAAPQGGLLPYFITYSNLASSNPATVRAGNERVVRPRLSDAEFFWKQDRKTTLNNRVADLGTVTFQKTLGSVLDKTRRVQTLAASIAQQLGADSAAAERAAWLAKADLLTNMVGEFPELQGTMGRYYANAEGEPAEVAAAIEEQYLPKISGGPLPETRTGQILALAEKFDTLAGIFSAGLIPTGDKDPYALRRAALGTIRILWEKALDLDVPALLDLALGQLKHSFDAAAVSAQVYEFWLERLRGYCLEQGFQHDEFEAVLAIRPARLPDFQSRLNAVREFRALPEAASLAAANKRIRNILRKAEGEAIPAEVDASGLVEAAEKSLLAAAQSAANDIRASLDQRDYTSALTRLAALRESVDGFFDGVMVMADDAALRRNRLALLALIERLFLNIADVGKLQG